jgi:hypothetical protein
MIVNLMLPSGERVRLDSEDSSLLIHPWSKHDTGDGFYVSC